MITSSLRSKREHEKS